MKTEEREKKGKKNLISQFKTKNIGFLNLLRFIAFTILVTFKNFVIRFKH